MLMFLDGEWNGYRGTLISLALVTVDDQEWYETLECFCPTPWVEQHVMANLQRAPVTYEEMQASLARFLGRFEGVDIIADWPEDIQRFCETLVTGPGQRLDYNGKMTFEIVRGLPDTAETSKVPHNALEDAKALRLSWMEAHDDDDIWEIEHGNRRS